MSDWLPVQNGLVCKHCSERCAANYVNSALLQFNVICNTNGENRFSGTPASHTRQCIYKEMNAAFDNYCKTLTHFINDFNAHQRQDGQIPA